MYDQSFDVAAARAVCEAATPGPWTWTEKSAYTSLCSKTASAEVLKVVVREPWQTRAINGRDAYFIRNARTLLPQALDEIQRLREALEAIIYASELATESRDERFYCAERARKETG